MAPQYSPVSNSADIQSEPPDTSQLRDTGDVSGKDGGEKKVVLLGAWANLWTSLVHVLPVTATVILLYINHTRHFWFEQDVENDGAPDQTLSPLQFAAKVHEILVILSLAAITLKGFRRLLIGSSGLPLNLITAPYRVGDVPFIFSFRFISVFWSSDFALSLVLFINTIISTLVGPASAVLMVPSPDWFPLHDAFGRLESPIFYTKPPDQTWPRLLADEAIDPGLFGCLGVNEPDPWCPGSGFQELWNWVASWQVTGFSNTLSVSNPAGAARRSIKLVLPKYYNYIQNGYNRPPSMAWLEPTIATTTSMPVLMTLTRLLNHVKFASQDAFGTQNPRAHDIGTLSNSTSFRVQTTSDAQILQPLVQTSCKLYRAEDLAEDDPKRFPYFPAEKFKCFGDTDCDKAIAATTGMYPPGKIWDRQSRNHTSWQVNIQAPRFNKTGTMHPVLISGVLPYLNKTSVYRWVFACTLLPHWIPARPIRVSLDQVQVIDEIAASSDITEGGYMAQITDAWLPYLDMASASSQEPEVAAGNRTTKVIPDPDSPGNDVLFRAQPRGSLTRLLGIASKTIPNPLGNGTIAVFDPGSMTTDKSFFVRDGNMQISSDVTLWYGAMGFLERLFSAVFADGLARAASKGESFVKTAQNETAVTITNLGVQQGLAADTARTVTYTWGDKIGGIVTALAQGVMPGGSETVAPIPVPPDATPDDARRLFGAVTMIPLEAEHYGYGFGNPSSTLRFALAVMYSYFAVLILYFLSVILFGTARTVAPWGDIHDMLVLAWTSDRALAPKGIQPYQEKRVTTLIRADPSGRVQLAREDCAGAEEMKMVERFVRYSYN
ncbi:hypothetical protein B0T14DRAFT_497127 [Immersiella caudata]|uniref:Uncharacterized protein n=1 Tax=Immersiella caudata TaxID=314043 RepID=A0AA40C113_9PEZI|nr:hypothetical protein B0T14DRAFT_497127 [Immersiella caudata]